MTALEQITAEQFRTLRLQRVKPRVLKVFGSRARGNAEADADLDVLVLIEELSIATDRFISDCAWEAGFENGICSLI